MNTVVHKLQVLLSALLVIACLVLSLVLMPATSTASSAVPATVDIENSPNVVTTGLSLMVNSLDRNLTAAQNSIDTSSQAIVAAVNTSGELASRSAERSAAYTSHAVVNTALFAVQYQMNGASFVGNTLVRSVALTANGTGRGLGALANTAAVRVVLQPDGSKKLPAIGDKVTMQPASKVAAATPKQASELPKPAPHAAESAMWPIHGAITTLFGVPEPPYQPIHTGIDISDGARSGVTPIHPFKSGRVVEVIHSHLKLGNEVVIDHGGGLTSVYGHMAYTAVQPGQKVDQSTVLGREGTTGVSTGVHLHFEIRVNGTPVNPEHYISGRP